MSSHVTSCIQEIGENMAVGNSGRVVIDIDAELKKELHAAVKKQGLSLKEWFIEKIEKDFPEIAKKHK